MFSLFTSNLFTKTNYIIVLKEDFSKEIKYKIFKKNLKKYEYFLPHNQNTTKRAMTIKEGVMVMQLEPGMRGWSGDKKIKLNVLKLEL